MSPIELLQDELKYIKDSLKQRQDVLESFEEGEQNPIRNIYYERVLKRSNELVAQIEEYEKAIELLKHTKQKYHV